MTAQLLPDGTITTPGGFRATGIHAGLKATRDRDLGLLIAKSACSAAAHFGAGSGAAGAWTTANLRRGAEDIRAVLVLSGVDGGRGAAAVAACNELADLLADEAAITAQNVAMFAAAQGAPAAETPFDLPLLRRGVPRALDELDSKGGQRLALALALPGQTPRMAAVSTVFGDREVSLGGLAVGAEPTRVLVTTNATLGAKQLKAALDGALADYPQLDQGSILILANGLAGAAAPKRASDASFRAWRAALAALIGHLLADPGA